MADDEEYTPQSDPVKYRWQKFNFEDWASDPCLRKCSLAAQGLWVRVVGLIYAAKDGGRLSDNGQPYSDAHLAAVLGYNPRTVRPLMRELLEAGVYDVEDGFAVSRRLKRESYRSQINAISGSNGGRKTSRINALARKSLKQTLKPSLKPKIPDTDTVVSKEETTAAKAAKEASPLQLDREFVWGVGKGLLTEAGASTAEAGALIGALVKRRGLAEAKALVLSMRANPPVDVRSYVAAVIHGRKPVQAVDDEPAHPIWVVERDEATGKLTKRRWT
tara:strand:+ start:66 stop:890 length:825 start_codon:yes stop_codon:yes gene_type:complete